MLAGAKHKFHLIKLFLDIADVDEDFDFQSEDELVSSLYIL